MQGPAEQSTSAGFGFFVLVQQKIYIFTTVQPALHNYFVFIDSLTSFSPRSSSLKIPVEINRSRVFFKSRLQTWVTYCLINIDSFEIQRKIEIDFLVIVAL